MQNDDFERRIIPPTYWLYSGGENNTYVEGIRACHHWMPLTLRAKAYLAIAAYYHPDKQLCESVQDAFNTDGMLISMVECPPNQYWGSRLRKSDKLISMLHGLENMFAMDTSKDILKRLYIAMVRVFEIFGNTFCSWLVLMTVLLTNTLSHLSKV